MNKVWYQISKLNAYARSLIFPVFIGGSILTFCSSMKRANVSWYDMPVIIIYCSERDFQSPEARTQALLVKDQPIARCQEKVTWQGEDREAIQGLVMDKSEKIAKALFAYSQNPSISREAAARTIEFFEPESPARSEFKRRMDEVVTKSQSQASGFTIRDSYVRFIERERQGESRWIAMISGIAVTEADNQKGRDVILKLSFKPTRYGLRKETQQALVVTEWEIIDDAN
jgi:hypothetical protein